MNNTKGKVRLSKICKLKKTRWMSHWATEPIEKRHSGAMDRTVMNLHVN